VTQCATDFPRKHPRPADERAPCARGLRRADVGAGGARREPGGPGRRRPPNVPWPSALLAGVATHRGRHVVAGVAQQGAHVAPAERVGGVHLRGATAHMLKSARGTFHEKRFLRPAQPRSARATPARAARSDAPPRRGAARARSGPAWASLCAAPPPRLSPHTPPCRTPGTASLCPQRSTPRTVRRSRCRKAGWRR